MVPTKKSSTFCTIVGMLAQFHLQLRLEFAIQIYSNKLAQKHYTFTQKYDDLYYVIERERRYQLLSRETWKVWVSQPICFRRRFVFNTITMLCGIDSILQNILYIFTECGNILQYFMEYCQSHKIWIWIMWWYYKQNLSQDFQFNFPSILW